MIILQEKLQVCGILLACRGLDTYFSSFQVGDLAHWWLRIFFLPRCTASWMSTYSPSGSQSFFRARHMGAFIRRFLPLERTVVALVTQTGNSIKNDNKW